MTDKEIRAELKRLRAENKLLKEIIRLNTSTKTYNAYLKALKQVPKKLSTYEEKFARESKKLKIKTKVINLMRQYNKLIKVSKTKITYPKITIKTLQQSGFKINKKNLTDLEAQLKESIYKLEGSNEYPFEYLVSMLDGIVFNLYKIEASPNLISTAEYIRDSNQFQELCESGLYNNEIYDILTLLYDAVANGEEYMIKQLLTNLLDIMNEYQRKG